MTYSGGDPSAPDSPDDLVDELAHLVGDRDDAERAIAELRHGLREVPDPEAADRHLAAMRAAAVELHAGGPVIDLRGRRIRRSIAGGVIAVVTLSATGGLAAAGVLPAPVQDAVSRAAGVIAIDLPRSSDSEPVRTTEPPGLNNVPGSTAPGRTGESPGDTAPGRTGESPSDTAPGRTGNSPSDTAPGRTGESPSDTAPGQTGNSPSDTAPGRTGESPSDTAPGQSPGGGGSGASGGGSGNPSDTAPGQSPGGGQGNPGGRGGN